MPNRNYITEAVIGSLPRPLSLKERASVSASVPLSNTLKLVGSLASNREVTARWAGSVSLCNVALYAQGV